MKFTLIKNSVHRLLQSKTRKLLKEMRKSLPSYMLKNELRIVLENLHEFITNLCGYELSRKEIEIVKLQSFS